ncbi:hypothetical protein A3J61_01430 [Candidatus Nomurabacteria bacterium RIFCSPHIGHO2_02_FULL_38_15]|uniref:Uncharacterized protein n=1 Tax=Candidatus Nomurabacteria bacterium RIFCSPHIGHO2_02_FULL_38_15 TaxID=1801752 RepID=A0A1F6VR24_9BACT|nr:MAG: hypothetical protein A3J61_01430 [Candidatus Nomurabacteria bacterium RIFCSPHIGHO2_02_FULL_38_15]
MKTVAQTKPTETGSGLINGHITINNTSTIMAHKDRTFVWCKGILKLENGMIFQNPKNLIFVTPQKYNNLILSKLKTGDYKIKIVPGRDKTFFHFFKKEGAENVHDLNPH